MLFDENDDVQNILDTDCQDAAVDYNLETLLSLAGFDESFTRFLIDFLKDSPNHANPLLSISSKTQISTILHRFSAQRFQITQLPMILIVRSKTASVQRMRTCVRSFIFDEEKETREKSISDWERHALISVVAAYGILLIAAVTISARFITLENKESSAKRIQTL